MRRRSLTGTTNNNNRGWIVDLTRQLVRECFNYDAVTGILVWRARPSHHFISDKAAAAHNRRYAGKVAGRLDTYGYRQIKINGRRYFAHAIAWLYTYGTWPRDEIDHENHKRDDNRIANLRDVVRAVNARNRCRPRANAAQAAPGVIKRGNRWYARISLTYLGAFASLADANAARKAAEARLGYHPSHGQVR